MTQPPSGKALVTLSKTLTPELRKKTEAIARALKSATGQAERLSDVTRRNIEDVAGQYDRAPSSVLAGIVGGVVGSAGGLALTTVAGTALVVTGPLGLALGAALAILAFRGPRYWSLERSTRKLQLALSLIRGEIATLPDDTPASVKISLWQQYERLMEHYGGIVHDSMKD